MRDHLLVKDKKISTQKRELFVSAGKEEEDLKKALDCFDLMKIKYYSESYDLSGFKRDKKNLIGLLITESTKARFYDRIMLTYREREKRSCQV